MKIFNWMHRKLLPSIKYSQVSQTKDAFGGEHEEKCEVIFEGFMEKEALIFHDVLSSILTIGTLGHQDNFLSQSYYSTQEDIHLEKEEENVVVEATDEKKAVLPTFLFNEPLPPAESFRFKLPVEEEGKKMEIVMHAEKTDKNEELPLLKEEKEKSALRRITLADLLAADAITMNNRSENAHKKTSCRFKQHANISSRKMQKNKKEEKWASTTTENTNSSTTTTTTTRRLQKLITKVLKKKVHPAIVSAPNTDGTDAK